MSEPIRVHTYDRLEIDDFSCDSWCMAEDVYSLERRLEREEKRAEQAEQERDQLREKVLELEEDNERLRDENCKMSETNGRLHYYATQFAMLRPDTEAYKDMWKHFSEWKYGNRDLWGEKEAGDD